MFAAAGPLECHRLLLFVTSFQETSKPLNWACIPAMQGMYVLDTEMNTTFGPRL